MTDFKKEYNDFYSNIKASKKLKNSIMDNTVNKVKVKRSLLFRICLSASCFIFAIAIIGISYVSAKTLENVVQKYLINKTLEKPAEESETGEDIYSCSAEIPINYHVNVDSQIEKDPIKKISVEDIEKELGVHILSNEDLKDGYEVINVEREGNKISTFTLLGIYRTPPAPMHMLVKALTPNASEEFISEHPFLYKYDCKDYNYEKITTKNGIDVYFYDDPSVQRIDRIPGPIQHVPAYFVYDNIGYMIVYYIIDKEQVIEFVESLS